MHTPPSPLLLVESCTIVQCAFIVFTMETFSQQRRTLDVVISVISNFHLNSLQTLKKMRNKRHWTKSTHVEVFPISSSKIELDSASISRSTMIDMLWYLTSLAQFPFCAKFKMWFLERLRGIHTIALAFMALEKAAGTESNL